MPYWPALLLSPSLALGAQVVAYALASRACAAPHDAWLPLVLPVAALFTLAFTLMAAARARRLRPAGEAVHVDADAGDLRAYFLARVAVGCGALSTLAIAAMWHPQLQLSPCLA